MIRGTLKAAGLTLLEVTNITFVMSTTMKARFAFVSDSGATMGWTDHSNWSKETLEKLAALKEAMERDVAQVYLAGYDGAVAPTSASAPKGLAEHLGGQEPSSV